MRWRPTARFFCLVLALPGLIGSTTPVDARSGQPGAVSRVRVWTYVTGASMWLIATNRRRLPTHSSRRRE